jgi:hypothetical protein
MQTSGIAEVETRKISSAPLLSLSVITHSKRSFSSLLDSGQHESMCDDDRRMVVLSPFENVTAEMWRRIEEPRIVWLRDELVDARPTADMSEWSSDLDDEARAIHGDLMDASRRALGDD